MSIRELISPLHIDPDPNEPWVHPHDRVISPEMIELRRKLSIIPTREFTGPPLIDEVVRANILRIFSRGESKES